MFKCFEIHLYTVKKKKKTLIRVWVQPVGDTHTRIVYKYATLHVMQKCKT